MTISNTQLSQIMPTANAGLLDNFLDEFNAQLPNYQIDTPLRVAAFIAQGAFESSELGELVECMYYTTSARLQQVWPNQFPSIASTITYLRNPEALGNYVYANRMGNGDIASGDGYNYRGRGFFNGTGKSFYNEMTELTAHDFIASPDDMAQPKYAVLSACEFWTKNNLNQYADASDLTTITKIINGALTGLDGRLVYYHTARQAFDIPTS